MYALLRDSRTIAELPNRDSKLPRDLVSSVVVREIFNTVRGRERVGEREGSPLKSVRKRERDSDHEIVGERDVEGETLIAGNTNSNSSGKRDKKDKDRERDKKGVRMSVLKDTNDSRDSDAEDDEVVIFECTQPQTFSLSDNKSNRDTTSNTISTGKKGKNKDNNTNSSTNNVNSNNNKVSTTTSNSTTSTIPIPIPPITTTSNTTTTISSPLLPLPLPLPHQLPSTTTTNTTSNTTVAMTVMRERLKLLQCELTKSRLFFEPDLTLLSPSSTTTLCSDDYTACIQLCDAVMSQIERARECVSEHRVKLVEAMESEREKERGTARGGSSVGEGERGCVICSVCEGERVGVLLVDVVLPCCGCRRLCNDCVTVMKREKKESERESSSKGSSRGSSKSNSQTLYCPVCNKEISRNVI